MGPTTDELRFICVYLVVIYFQLPILTRKQKKMLFVGIQFFFSSSEIKSNYGDLLQQQQNYLVKLLFAFRYQLESNLILCF